MTDEGLGRGFFKGPSGPVMGIDPLHQNQGQFLSVSFHCLIATVEIKTGQISPYNFDNRTTPGGLCLSHRSLHPPDDTRNPLVSHALNIHHPALPHLLSLKNNLALAMMKAALCSGIDGS